MAVGLACLFLSACGGTGQSGAQDLFSAFTTGYNPALATAPALPSRPGSRFSPENPATILVIGDSLSNGFGTFLKLRAEQLDLNARVINQGKSSSGLTRGDFYDWPTSFEGFAAQHKPDIVVAHFGVILTQLQRALGVTPYKAISHKIDNLSVTRLQHDAGNWVAEHINHCP